MREWATFCKADGCNRRTKSDCGFCWQHHDMKPAKYLSNPKPMTLEQARQDERRWLAEWMEKNNTADAMNKLLESLNEDGFEIVIDAEWLCVGEKIWQPFLAALKEGRRP